MSKYVYVAGPLFNSHERWYLDQINAALEKEGYRTFLPHRDAGVLGDLSQDAERLRVFTGDMNALNACDFLTALLTGADHDSGTCCEIGYAYAHHKPIFGISDDVRRLNNMVWGMCDEGRMVARDIPTLIDLIRGRGM